MPAAARGTTRAPAAAAAARRPGAAAAAAGLRPVTLLLRLLVLVLLARATMRSGARTGARAHSATCRPAALSMVPAKRNETKARWLRRCVSFVLGLPE